MIQLVDLQDNSNHLFFLSAPSCLMLQNVTELSDDETVAPQPLPAPDETSVVSKTRPSCKRKMSALELASAYSDLTRSLRCVANSCCRCFNKGKGIVKRNCFIPFRQPAVFNEVLQLRKTLRTMHKVDADLTATLLSKMALTFSVSSQLSVSPAVSLLGTCLTSSQVFNILTRRHSATDAAPSSTKQRHVRLMQLFGHKVCLAGLSRLLGIGTERLTKMRKAIRAKLDAPYADGRKTSKAKWFGDSEVSTKRRLIHDFLYGLYCKATGSVPETSADSYAGATQKCKALRFRRFKRKRPRLNKKRDDKRDEHSASLVRMLRPGTYMDYLRIFKAEHQEMHLQSRSGRCPIPHVVPSFAMPVQRQSLLLGSQGCLSAGQKCFRAKMFPGRRH